MVMTSEASSSTPREAFDPSDENRAYPIANGADGVRNERDEALRKIKLLERNLANLRTSAAKTARELELTNQEIVESARYRLEAESWSDSEGEGKPRDGEDPSEGPRGRERLQASHWPVAAAGGKKAEDSERLKQATEGYCVQTKALLRRSIAATDVVVADMIRARKDAGRHKAKSEQLERTVYKLDAMLKQSHARRHGQPQAKILLRKWILRQKRTLVTAVVRCWSAYTRQAITSRVTAEADIRNRRCSALSRTTLQSWRRCAEGPRGQLASPSEPGVDIATTTQTAALEEEIVLLKATRDQLEADKAGLRVECERASKELRERETELRAVQEAAIGTSSLASDLAAERERSASLEARLEDTAAKVAEFQAMLERNQARAPAMKEKASSVTGESPDASPEVEQLRTRIEGLELELERAEGRRRAGEEGLLIESSKEDEIEDTREKWAQYQKTQLKLASLKEDLQGQLRVNEELKASSSAEKEAMLKELEGLRAEMANLAEANEELRRAAEGLQAREDQLNRRLALSREEAEVSKALLWFVSVLHISRGGMVGCAFWRGRWFGQDQRARLAEDLQSKVGELQDKLNAVEEEKKRSAEALTSARDALMARVKGLEIQLKGYEEERESSRSEKERMEEETEKLKASLYEVRKENERQAKEAADSLDEAMAKMERERQELRSDKANLQKEIDEARARLEVSEEQLRETQEVEERTKVDNEKVVESLRSQLGSLREEHARSVDEMNGSHQKEVESLTATVDALETKIRDMKVAEEKGEMADDEQRRKLQSELEELERRSAEREAELEREVAEMSRQLEAVKEELQEKASDLASRVGRLEEQTALCDEAKRELSTERTERVAVEERSQKTEEELQEVMARVEEADRKVSDLEEALKRALSEKAQLLEENVVLGERIGAFEESSAGEEALVSQLNEAKAQLQSLQADNQKQVERMEELEASKKTLADDIWKQEVCLKEAEEGRQKAETALHKTEAELSSSRAQLEEMVVRAAGGVDALENSKKRCEELERALREATATGDAREQEMSQECSRLREAIAEMEGQLTEAIRLSEEKSEEMKSLQKTIDTLRETIHHGEGEKKAGRLLAALKKSIDEVRSVVEGKESALATLENQIGKLKSKLAEEDALQRELCKELEEARQEIELLKERAEIDTAVHEEVAGLQEEADAAREHIADLNRQLNEAQDEISRLTEAMREVEGSIEARAASSDKLINEQRESHAATVQNLEEDKRATEVIVKERGMEIARLEELLKSAEGASEDLKGSVETLQRRLSEATEREAASEAELVGRVEGFEIMLALVPWEMYQFQ
ncbi:3-dehydrosphinganine reductase, partial [Perkinsus olseni]